MKFIIAIIIACLFVGLSNAGFVPTMCSVEYTVDPGMCYNIDNCENNRCVANQTSCNDLRVYNMEGSCCDIFNDQVCEVISEVCYEIGETISVEFNSTTTVVNAVETCPNKNCLDELQTEYPENEEFNCWYNPENNRVMFDDGYTSDAPSVIIGGGVFLIVMIMLIF